MNEFKERIQFLLTQALNTQKKQQCLIEFNKLCIANKTEGHLKLLLSTLEMLKMNEVNLRALKISIQIYQYDLQNSMKAAQLIIKGYPEGNEALYQFSGECFRLLTNNESILPFCELLCPLALKLNSQPIQIGSTISLQYVLQFEVQINIKKQIQLAFIKNSLIIHQSFVEIMIQITQKDDINLGQILQRCLAGLQEQKHSYQVKIQLCKLLQQISSYTTYEQNQLLQCVTILREVTLNKVIALQQIAKQALSSYQSLYIAINPPSITNSNFFPDIKPFIKKKRGDNHLILDTDKQKKLKISQIPQIKQQLDRLKISSIDEQIQTELLEQQIQNDQKQNEQLNISQEIINSNIQEINNESKDTQIYEDVQLLKTLDYNDEIDNNSYDYTQDALKKINDGEINDAFKIALQQKDDLLLIKLMMNTNDYFKSLTRQTAEELIKLIKIMILLLIISLVNAKLIAPRKVHYAIDCGSNSDTRTSAGIKFLKDKNYQGNSFAMDYHQEIGKQKIKFTDDIQLYETQREGLDFIYNIPIPTQQKQNWYVLILKFAELKYNLPSERVFQVLLGEKLILQNIDIISLVGNYTALTEYIEIYIENNQVFYQGEECNNAINNKNELTLRFVGEKNQATIAGLFLFIGSIDQTDWEDKLQNQEIWLKRNTVDLKQQSKQQAKQHEEILKEKQNIIKIREGFAHELPIEEIEKPQKNKLPIFSLELLFLMLKTPLGVVLSIGFLTVCYVSISFLFFNPYNIKVPEKQRTIKKD